MSQQRRLGNYSDTSTEHVKRIAECTSMTGNTVRLLCTLQGMTLHLSKIRFGRSVARKSICLKQTLVGHHKLAGECVDRQVNSVTRTQKQCFFPNTFLALATDQ